MNRVDYRILIVEDEPLERKALQMILERMGRPLEIRTAATALEFREQVLSWKPDAVLLDIRIPGGDGLSTLHELRGEGYAGEAVVITAFDVFEYAQQAMGQGVLSFLVKPVTPGVLEDVVGKICRTIDEKRDTKARFDQIQEFVTRNRGAFAMAIIQDLLREKGIEEHVRGIMAGLGLPPGRSCYLFGIACLSDDENQPRGENLFLLEALERNFNSEVVAVPWRRFSSLIFVPCARQTLSGQDTVASELLGIISTQGFQANVVYGGRISLLEEIAPAVTLLEEALEESLLGGMGRIIMREDTSADVTEPVPGLSGNTLDVARETLLAGFMNGQPELVSRGSAQISEFLCQMSPQDLELSKLLVLSLLGGICQVLINLKCEGAAVRNWARRQMLNLMAPNTPMGIRKIFAESMDQAWNVRASASDSGAAIIQQSLQYIQEHSDEVTLESLAESVHVSPAYLSRLFRRVLKRRFVDEVKAVRIERAKTLLSQGLSVRDVALEVGYGNIAYFSTLFRQTTGQSPSEYRKTFQ